MIPSEILIKGRDFLQEHTWGRGDYHDPKKNTYCAIGALYCGVYGENYWEEGQSEELDEYDLPVHISERYLDRTSPNKSITSFNDTTAKRKRDVITRYNMAIKTAQQEGN